MTTLCGRCGNSRGNHLMVGHDFEDGNIPSSAELLQALIKERNDRREQLRKDLTQVLNKNGAEQDSNTPDYILADMLISHLEAFNRAVTERRNWFGITEKEGSI